MSNALSFNGSGNVALSNYIWSVYPSGNAGAIEFYLQTRAASAVFFSSNIVDLFQETELGGYGVVLYADSLGLLWLQTTGSAFGTTTVTTYSTGTQVCDGNWHQVSLYCDTTQWNLFVDGNPITLDAVSNSANDEGLGIGTISGSLSFGSDIVNSTPLAAAYTGLLSELRVWAGGDPNSILTPAFALNYGVPVSATSLNLVYYWPFWTNGPGFLIDMVSKTPLPLHGQVVETNTSQYYNDLSEVVCNGTMAPFNEFTTGTTGAAFTYLIGKAGLPGYTPTTFRELYLQSSNQDTLGSWASDIQNASYPGTDICTQADFDTVQTALAQELTGASLVWGFYQSAYDNLGFVASQYTSAQSTVYTALSVDSMQISTPAPSPVNSIFDAVAAIAGAACKSGSPEGIAIKVAASALGFLLPATPNPSLNFGVSLTIQADAATLDKAVTTLIQNMYGAVYTSLSIILGNAGLLDLVYSRLANGLTFEFGADLNPATNAEINSLVQTYNASVLLFTQTVLCSSFPIYVFYMSEYGAYPPDVEFDIQDATFQYVFGNGPCPWDADLTFGGQALIGTVSIGDTYTTYSTLPSAVASMLTAAAGATSTQTLTQQELFTEWPFTVQQPE